MSPLSQESADSLIEAARKAGANAYAPYSGFYVGAALLTEGGDIFTGANVENASYSLTICAERAAVFAAVNQGHTVIRAIAVAATSGETAYPCGACRQVLAEFGDTDVYVEEAGRVTRHRLSELLAKPFALGPKEQK